VRLLGESKTGRDAGQAIQDWRDHIVVGRPNLASEDPQPPPARFLAELP